MFSEKMLPIIANAIDDCRGRDDANEVSQRMGMSSWLCLDPRDHGDAGKATARATWKVIRCDASLRLVLTIDPNYAGKQNINALHIHIVDERAGVTPLRNVDAGMAPRNHYALRSIVPRFFCSMKACASAKGGGRWHVQGLRGVPNA